jgi:sigma-E factor negative regulatory protein RseA
MTIDQTPQGVLPEQISAAMDGDAQAADAVARAWKNNASVRADWHAYQLIGDVLRSADCANPSSRDAALLARVRERLAAEPVVLAPSARSTAAHPMRPKRAGWWAPAAVAAGFVAVVGMVVVQPQTGPASSAGVTAAAVTAVIPVSQTSLQPREVQPTQVAVGAASAPLIMIRSAELDRYLAAHQQFSSTSAVPAPGVVVRSVSTVAPSR